MVSFSNSGLHVLIGKTNVAVRLPDLNTELYTLNEFTTADNFVADVPSNSLSFRSIPTISENKQEVLSCYCKRYCIDKKCGCRTKSIKYNSKCHHNGSCKNK
jgi:hypothetical protein